MAAKTAKIITKIAIIAMIIFKIFFNSLSPHTDVELKSL
jgi:uncharacterized membrane protein YjfL (UPF0719 family)